MLVWRAADITGVAFIATCKSYLILMFVDVAEGSSSEAWHTDKIRELGEFRRSKKMLCKPQVVSDDVFVLRIREMLHTHG